MSRKRSRSFGKIDSLRGKIRGLQSIESFLFLPGIFLLLTGVALLFAPRLLVATTACFLVSCGVLLCLIVQKILLFKRRILPMLKGLEGQVLIHKPQLSEVQYNNDEKKLLIH